MGMKKMKISAAKCMKVDTPELELPMFTNTYRFANSLARRPRLGQGSGFKNVMETFMKMQMFSQMMESDDSPGNFISKRAADEDVYDLGEKLHNKLEHKKEEMEEMYGNMTCMLRECNVLDSENKFYPEGIKMEFEQMKIKDQWLKSELEKYCDQCIELAEAVPQSMLDDCPWGGEMVKTKFFMKCMMKKKIKTCMHYDIKTKIEAQFGPMKDLVQETKIPEKQLYMIVKQMLKGPEEMMMMTSKMTKITSPSKDLSSLSETLDKTKTRFQKKEPY